MIKLNINVKPNQINNSIKEKDYKINKINTLINILTSI